MEVRRFLGIPGRAQISPKIVKELAMENPIIMGRADDIVGFGVWVLFG